MQQVKVTLPGVDEAGNPVSVVLTIGAGPAVEVGSQPETVADIEKEMDDLIVAAIVETVPVARRELVRQLLALTGRYGLFPVLTKRPNNSYVLFKAPQLGHGKVAFTSLNKRDPLRFGVVLDPSLQPEFPGSRVAENKYLDCFISSEEDLQLAEALLRRALMERGWTE